MLQFCSFRADTRRIVKKLPMTLILSLAMVVFITGCGKHEGDSASGISSFGLERGLASWYGEAYQYRKTASGELFDMNKLTAAHRTLPFGTVVEVQRMDNGRRVQVRINDRGPYVDGRIIDLSRRAADQLGMLDIGLAEVVLRIVN